MSKHTKYLLTIIIVFAHCFTACKEDESILSEDNKDWKEQTVAVVLPMGNGFSKHWERTLGLFSSNFQSAFVNQQQGVKLKFEYYDETASDLEETISKISKRDDIYAVVGGLYSSHAQTIASKICISGKPFFTLATSDELVRGYASTGYLWAMTETDITQSEVLLSKVINYGGKSVALIAKEDDLYGKTFIDWFAFQAKELGIENKGLFQYTRANVHTVAEKAVSCGADFLLCVPSEIDEIQPMLTAHRQYSHSGNVAPQLLFSDTAYGTDVLSLLGKSAEGLEGVAFGASPETGFDVSYKTYLGLNPTTGEAQLYDAAMLVGYAAWYQLLYPEVNFMNALRKIVTGTDMNMGSWMGEDMRLVIDALQRGGFPSIKGASGPMTFDSKVFTNVLSTTYYNYKVYNGQYIILDYNTSDGSNRTDATLAGWNWKASQMQDFADSDALLYPEHKGNKALLIASSKGWMNYRHQADVLAIYQLLKKYGYDDESIILIMEDDIAENSANPNKGVVQVTMGGENVHDKIKVDYKMSELLPADVMKILKGEKSDKLNTVLELTENDNLFVFWSGHGKPGALCWNDDAHSITGQMLASTFSQMHDAHAYRKVLMMVEACYSGGVMEQCSGIPGMLFFTAANGDETSKADIFNENLLVWMSNRFTSTFIQQITDNRDIAMRDLYYRLFINTVGSHVMVYNAESYGNLYNSDMNEFMNYKQNKK